MDRRPIGKFRIDAREIRRQIVLALSHRGLDERLSIAGAAVKVHQDHAPHTAFGPADRLVDHSLSHCCAGIELHVARPRWHGRGDHRKDCENIARYHFGLMSVTLAAHTITASLIGGWVLESST